MNNDVRCSKVVLPPCGAVQCCGGGAAHHRPGHCAGLGPCRDLSHSMRPALPEPPLLQSCVHSRPTRVAISGLSPLALPPAACLAAPARRAPARALPGRRPAVSVLARGCSHGLARPGVALSAQHSTGKCVTHPLACYSAPSRGPDMPPLERSASSSLHIQSC